jgi:hypothetical protein
MSKDEIVRPYEEQIPLHEIAFQAVEPLKHLVLNSVNLSGNGLAVLASPNERGTE